MTEKRFFILKDEEFDVSPCIRDRNSKIDDIYGHYKYDDIEQICLFLNEQNDEIELLKSKFEDCEFAHRTEMALHRVIEKDLKKENEQLKKELVEFKKWEKHIGNVKREELDRIFKMSIYEIADAFEYYKKRVTNLERRLQE